MLTILNIVSPVFLVIGVGYILKERGLLPENTPKTLSWIVFNLSAPALLFRSAALAPVHQSIDPWITIAVFFVTSVTAGVVYFFARSSGPSRVGVIAQGAFRSNLVFVGLPVVLNAYGSEPKAIAPVATVIGLTVPLYNLLAVAVLLFPHRKNPELELSLRGALKDIARNPLIVSSLLGILCAMLDLTLPVFLDRSLELIARSASPMALLVVGASLDFRKWSAELTASLVNSGLKLIAYPAFYFLILLALDWLDLLSIGTSHKAVLLLLSAPTAVAAHIMAKEMGGDEHLSASVVVSSTTLSLFSISGWLLFLQWMG